MSKIKQIVLIVINAFIAVSTFIISLIGGIYGASVAQRGEAIIGINYLKPYTMDSNILLGIIALIYLIFLIISMVRKKKIQSWVIVLYYIGCVSIALTFLTVIFFLAPSSALSAESNPAEAFFSNFSEDLFFFHFLNPILAVISFFLMESEKKISIFDNLFAIIPMFVYSIVYCIEVVFVKAWDDFYGFTFGGRMYLVPLVIVVIYGVTFLIGLVLAKLKNKQLKKQIATDSLQ